jgi:tetratricopeptide (TPR) repeat protein
MASRLGPFVFFFALTVATASLPCVQSAAFARGMNSNSQAEAKEATRLYKAGQYEEAAKLFAKLAVDHPDMPIFERSLGACFYYLHRPEPALSNLRNYLRDRADVPADDKEVVDRWIAEMEKLDAQNKASAAPATEAAPTGATASGPPLTAALAVSGDKPAGVDLSAQPSSNTGKPIYKTWWLWTGAAAVVTAGVVATILLMNRSSNPCDGASLACRGVQ